MNSSLDGISPSSAGSGGAGVRDDSTTGLAEPPKKRQRKREVDPNKKHSCPEPGCGKSFSRPDHLSRHRLNHNPIQTYQCSRAGCTKTFVRLDLLVRHEERHERKLDPEKAAAHKARQQAAQARAVPAQPHTSNHNINSTSPDEIGSEPGRHHGFEFGVLPSKSEDNNALSSNSTFPQAPYGLTNPFPAGFPGASNGAFTAFPNNGPVPSFMQQQAQHNHASGAQQVPMFNGQLNNQQLGFRQDASTSASNGEVSNMFGVPQPSNFTAAQQPSQPSAQTDLFGVAFDTNTTGPRIEPLDLVQASYGAPFVSASEYDWLFDPSGGFDISFPSSRPASPFGSAGPSGQTALPQMSQMALPNLDGMGHLSGVNANDHARGSNGLNSALPHDSRELAFTGFSPMPNQWSAIHQSPQALMQQSPQTDSSAVSPHTMPGASSQQQQQQQRQSHVQGNPPQQQQFQQQQSQHHPQQRSWSMSDMPTEQNPAAGHHSNVFASSVASASISASQFSPPPLQASPKSKSRTTAPALTSKRKDRIKPAGLEALLPPAQEPSAQTLTPQIVIGQDKETQTPPSTDLPTPVVSGPPEPPARDIEPMDAPVGGAMDASTTTADSAMSGDKKHDVSVYIDLPTRQRIIDYMGHEWKHLRSDVRMSRAAMMEYLELFWSKVHETQAPAVHRASFKACSVQTPLLLSMMLLGCYFASKDAYKLAGQLHPAFRGKVLCSADFRPRRDIWSHQTILLLIIFGKLCSSRMDHEMAHIFWSSCVTLGRRSAIFSQRPPVGAEIADDVEAQWAAWVDEEVAKRVALIIFGVDVEHAAFFRHSPTLSAFQIQLQLPCDEEHWEARSAAEWARLRPSQRPPIPFISALKASLMNNGSPPPLNPFSRIAILHGLLSVAQDLQWRDHVIGMSQNENRASNWRDMISASYNSWKSGLDTCLVTATFPTSQLLRASISLYAVAHITLSIDIHELQIYAGAQSALGLVVSGAIYSATEARIKLWAQTKDARAANWHAAFFLRSSLHHYQQTGVDLAGCLHHRWSVFIACLTLYCYGRSTSGEPGPPSSDAQYQAKAMEYLDDMCTASPELLINVPGKNNSLDLCRVVCEYIEPSRWEIAREGSRILKKLLVKNPSAPTS